MQTSPAEPPTLLPEDWDLDARAASPVARCHPREAGRWQSVQTDLESDIAPAMGRRGLRASLAQSLSADDDLTRLERRTRQGRVLRISSPVSIKLNQVDLAPRWCCVIVLKKLRQEFHNSSRMSLSPREPSKSSSNFQSPTRRLEVQRDTVMTKAKRLRPGWN